MVKDNMKICDYDKIIVDDGKTILPGYIEAGNDQILMYMSNDPNNAIAQDGVLKNRHVDDQGNDVIQKMVIGTKFARKDFHHFCNTRCFDNWVYKNSLN